MAIPIYDQLGQRLMSMLLCEPGSQIEGPTEDVLRVLFEATFWELQTELGDHLADVVALRHLARVHEALTQAGYVVRQYPGDD